MLAYVSRATIKHNPDMQWFAESAQKTLDAFDEKAESIPEPVKEQEPIIDEVVDVPDEAIERIMKKHPEITKATQISVDTGEIIREKTQEELKQEVTEILTADVPVEDPEKEIEVEEAIVEELVEEAEAEDGQSP